MTDISTAELPNGQPPGGPLTSVQFNTGPRWDMPVAVLVDMLEGIASDSPQLFAEHWIRATTGITGVVKGRGGRPRGGGDQR